MNSIDYSLALVIRPKRSLPKSSNTYGANSAPLIILYSPSNWLARNMKPKNIHHLQVAWRSLCEAERNAVDQAWRLRYEAYHDWESLIEDEIRLVGEKHPFVEELKALRDDPEYCYIPKKKRG